MYVPLKAWQAERDMLDKATEALEFFLASKKPIYGWHIRVWDALDQEMRKKHPRRHGGLLVGAH